MTLATVTLAAGLIVSRFLHYLAAFVLFGATLFALYGMGLAPTQAYRRLSWLRFKLLTAATMTLLSAMSWLVFTAAGMSGDPNSAIDPGTLVIVLRDTAFGQVWTVRLVLAAIALALVLPRGFSRWRIHAVLGCSFILVASIAATGHAGSSGGTGGTWHRIADAIHLVAAALWIGALFAFSALLLISTRIGSESDVRLVFRALARFSNQGTFIVALLLASGIVNAWFLVGPANVFNLPRTLYGQVLLLKLVGFVAMLGLAALNRLRLTPRLALALDSGTSTQKPLRALRTSLIAETLFGILVLAAVSWLGTLAPPGLE